MFTGIIEELGKIKTITTSSICISASKVLEDTKIGDSIAVNGVCLTVTDLKPSEFSADVSQETLKVTALKELKEGCFVNLERALTLNSRLGGHIVSGHIDTVGKLYSIFQEKEFYNLKIEHFFYYQRQLP